MPTKINEERSNNEEIPSSLQNIDLASSFSPEALLGKGRSLSMMESFCSNLQIDDDQISNYDGANSLIQNSRSSSLLSFMDTLDLYRKSAKRSSNAEAKFDFAKYLIETSLLPDDYFPFEDMPSLSPEILAASSSQISLPQMQSNNDPQDPVISKKKALQLEGIKILKRLSYNNTGLGRAPLPEAQYYLAQSYSKGKFGFVVDHTKAFHLYLQASKQNHPEATYHVAYSYENGLGTKKDSTRAVQFYRKASALSDPYAMHKLALILQYGLLGQTKNPRESVSWLKRAAAMTDSTYPQPINDLALCYMKHGGSSAVIPDEIYAFELFLRAAELGYPPSQYKIGSCYEYGLLGCSLDAGLSIKWYTKAAEQGDHEAELSLSGWYLTGAEGFLEQNEQEAFKWAWLSAEKKFHKAEYALGHFYESGIGVEKNLIEAKDWYKKAAAQGNKRASKRLPELKKLIRSTVGNCDSEQAGNGGARGNPKSPTSIISSTPSIKLGICAII